MRQNHVKRALKAGKPSIGTWVSYPHPLMLEALAEVGFDWLTLDMEHNAFDYYDMALAFAALRGSASAPFVRLPDGTHENIKRALDAGAWGIVCPMVNTPAQAELIAKAAKYPMSGGNRGIGGGRYNASFGAKGSEYREQADQEICVVIMLESPTGVNNLDTMLAIPGIDACFVGPNDLLGNMGETPAMWSESKQFKEAMEHLLATCKKHGVAAGIHCADAKAVSARIADGFQWLALASEARFLLHEATTEANAVTGWQPRTETDVIKY